MPQALALSVPAANFYTPTHRLPSQSCQLRQLSVRVVAMAEQPTGPPAATGGFRSWMLP